MSGGEEESIVLPPQIHLEKASRCLPRLFQPTWPFLLGSGVVAVFASLFLGYVIFLYGFIKLVSDLCL